MTGKTEEDKVTLHYNVEVESGAGRVTKTCRIPTLHSVQTRETPADRNFVRFEIGGDVENDSA
jgi:hypothetical protein